MAVRPGRRPRLPGAARRRAVAAGLAGRAAGGNRGFYGRGSAVRRHRGAVGIGAERVRGRHRRVRALPSTDPGLRRLGRARRRADVREPRGYFRRRIAATPRDADTPWRPSEYPRGTPRRGRDAPSTTPTPPVSVDPALRRYASRYGGLKEAPAYKDFFASFILYDEAVASGAVPKLRGAFKMLCSTRVLLNISAKFRGYPDRVVGYRAGCVARGALRERTARRVVGLRPCDTQPNGSSEPRNSPKFRCRNMHAPRCAQTRLEGTVTLVTHTGLCRV